MYISITIIIILLSNILLFSEILQEDSITINVFEQVQFKLEKEVWSYCKILYFVSLIISWLFLSYSIFKNINIKKENIISNSYIYQKDELKLKIGTTLINNTEVVIPEKGLYQNILITGTIGTRQDIISNVSFFRTIFKTKSWHVNIRC